MYSTIRGNESSSRRLLIELSQPTYNTCSCTNEPHVWSVRCRRLRFLSFIGLIQDETLQDGSAGDILLHIQYIPLNVRYNIIHILEHPQNVRHFNTAYRLLWKSPRLVLEKTEPCAAEISLCASQSSYLCWFWQRRIWSPPILGLNLTLTKSSWNGTVPASYWIRMKTFLSLKTLAHWTWIWWRQASRPTKYPTVIPSSGPFWIGMTTPWSLQIHTQSKAPAGRKIIFGLMMRCLLIILFCKLVTMRRHFVQPAPKRIKPSIPSSNLIIYWRSFAFPQLTRKAELPLKQRNSWSPWTRMATRWKKGANVFYRTLRDVAA